MTRRTWPKALGHHTRDTRCVFQGLELQVALPQQYVLCHWLLTAHSVRNWRRATRAGRGMYQNMGLGGQ